MPVLIVTEEDGSQWVKLEDYETMRNIALESKMIIENIQKQLGVYTTTSAILKIQELLTRSAQQRNEPGVDIPEASLQEPEFAIIGDVQINYCSLEHLNSGKKEIYTKWFSANDAMEFLKEQLRS